MLPTIYIFIVRKLSFIKKMDYINAQRRSFFLKIAIKKQKENENVKKETRYILLLRYLYHFPSSG